jgi:hydrogenase nickel incorporation protein HypB
VTKPPKHIDIAKPVLSKNDELAARNRERLAATAAFVVNMISSPGSGKTTLLEAMGRLLGDRLAVIEGDVQTRRDADRLEKLGIRAVQIETGGACHLDAARVARALDELALEERPCELLVIENVGNLVCPSSFDLGEHMKVALLSLPEGDDKVLKYPAVFRRIGALVITKIDLAPHIEFDVARAVRECASLNDAFETFRVSAKTGEGVQALCDGLLAQRGG